MRERIERDTGVKVPSTTLHENDKGELAPNHSLIMLHEVPLLKVRVVHGGSYCLADAERVKALGIAVLDSENDPLDHSRACWVESKDCARMRAAGVEVVDDHHAYIVRQLEALLRKNLADFIGVDAVEKLLLDWREKFNRAETIDRLRGDDAKLRPFTRLLRRLARERVSIADGAAIMDAVTEVGLADEFAALHAVRLRLRDRLAPAAARRVQLAPDIEASCLKWLHEVDGKTVLALPPEEAQELLAKVRMLVDTAVLPALVVESQRLRPHLRDLLEIEFLDVAVLAAEELAGAEAAAA
jgi:type III secretory pathway component EscV